MKPLVKYFILGGVYKENPGLDRPIEVYFAVDVKEQEQEIMEMLKQTYLDLRTIPLQVGVEQAKARIDLWLTQMKAQLGGDKQI
jgi:hypothetical protein